MNKLISVIMVLLLFGFESRSQNSYNAKILDTTVVDAKTPAVVLNVVGPKQAVTFQYSITKNTGTVAGTIVLSGSIDGGTTWAQLDSYTLTDATASKSVSYSYNGYTKYRALITTSGTLNANFKIWALYRN